MLRNQLDQEGWTDGPTDGKKYILAFKYEADNDRHEKSQGRNM